MEVRKITSEKRVDMPKFIVELIRRELSSFMAKRALFIAFDFHRVMSS